jgi:hypothetical protein
MIAQGGGVSIGDAARARGCTRPTLYRDLGILQTGDTLPFKIGASSASSRAELDKWIDEQPHGGDGGPLKLDKSRPGAFRGRSTAAPLKPH